MACFFRKPHGKREEGLSIKSGFFFILNSYDENSVKLIIQATTSLPLEKKGSIF